MDGNDARKLGSETAKQGFQNEKDVVCRINQWATDDTARKWLSILGYHLDTITAVNASQVTGSHKADIRVTVDKDGKSFSHFIQVKLVSNLQGYNQIDKRWVDKYAEIWSIPSDIVMLLKLYTGQSKPTSIGRDSRRMFASEFGGHDKEQLITFFKNNKKRILKTIFAGDDSSAAQWLLVVQKVNRDSRWALWPMEQAIGYFGEGDVAISDRGSIHLGKITIQRKGGDAGRETAKMLQFKINPAQILQSK